MSSKRLLYETHSHTPLCNHAFGEPEQYAKVAEQRGLKGIIVTCHCPMNNGASPHVRMRVKQFQEYVAMVERAREAWAGRIDVRLGLESDYVPGIEPWLEELHGWAELHYVLGSVHIQLSHYKEQYFNGDFVAYQRLYFEHLAQAAETGLFDCLAHPDLVKNIAPSHWQLERVMDDVCRALDRIAATGIAMELNTSGLHKRMPEMNPSRAILAEMQRRQIPVVVGADAHRPYRVAEHFEEALDTLADVGYTQVSIFLNRERQEIDLQEARQSLRDPWTRW